MSKVAFQKNTLVMRTENGVSSLYFDFNEQNPYNVGGEQVDVSGATLKVVLKMSNATQVTYNYSKNSNTTFNAASKLTVTGPIDNTILITNADGTMRAPFAVAV